MYLIIYLLLGVIFNIIGPIAKKTKASFLDVKSNSMANYLSDGIEPPKWRIFFFQVFFRLLIMLFYPIFFVIILIDIYRKKP
ncbi:MAG: hypothetical protein ACOYMA_04000 [Bacteroidia bacterium]